MKREFDYLSSKIIFYVVPFMQVRDFLSNVISLCSVAVIVLHRVLHNIKLGFRFRQDSICIILVFRLITDFAQWSFT